MKLDILDAYNIRARLSPSVILLGPIALTIFFCFEGLYSNITSALTLCILLALSNCVPIIQRRLAPPNKNPENYAAKYLQHDDTTIDRISKKRYYKKLTELENAFSGLSTHSSSQEFHNLCESAVIYLRNNTRDNHLVLEENINYGFCKNMLINKPIGIIINICLAMFTSIFSISTYGALEHIPSQNILSFGINIFFILFWIFGITKKMLEEASKRYAYTLIVAIDSIPTKKD
ncbi:MAG: hypothetical protein J6U54_13950 [Clostridiales bacterium]|nr:hypothetical protein [Clostridiales bacterium]